MKDNRYHILILDADHKNTLAIVRHLGKTGKYSIDLTGHNKNSISFFSKYVSGKHLTGNPNTSPGKYLEDIIHLLKRKKYLTVIPVSHISYKILSKYKKEVSEYTHITIPDYKQVETASNKIETYALARNLKIPYPEIITLQNIDEIENIDTVFPCVIKAPFEAGKNLVEYANNKNELIAKYKKLCKENDFGSTLPVIQKYIQGEGAGFFAFYKEGKCVNYFMHQRIREYPVTGGASTAAKSFYDESVMNYGKRILDSLNWNGVAMVEFKKDNKTGIFNLMEINAKFWGSLDLALEAGINFPEMLIDNALGNTIKKYSYKNIRFQWILNGDLFHVFERPKDFPSFVKDLFTAKNDILISDIKPNLFQLSYIPVHYYKKWFK